MTTTRIYANFSISFNKNQRAGLMKKILSTAIIAALLAGTAQNASARTVIVRDEYPVQYVQTEQFYEEGDPEYFATREVYYEPAPRVYHQTRTVYYNDGGYDQGYDQGYESAYNTAPANYSSDVDPIAPLVAVGAIAAAVVGIAAIAGHHNHHHGHNNYSWNNHGGHGGWH